VDGENDPDDDYEGAVKLIRDAENTTEFLLLTLQKSLKTTPTTIQSLLISHSKQLSHVC